MSRYLPALEARRLLEQSGVVFSPWRLVHSAQDALEAAQALGTPLALKTASEDIVHKSDAGCVVLDVQSPEQAAQAYTQIVDRASAAGSARPTPVVVERMAQGLAEVLLGIARDPTFGPVLLVGMGGLWVEVMHDVQRALCPVTTEQAAQMFSQLQGAALLQGGRGRPLADVQALAVMAASLSRFAMEHPEIAALDMNPVMAQHSGALAVDARIQVDDEGYTDHAAID
jgi:acyl-CoA synthetase (NDP forming)